MRGPTRKDYAKVFPWLHKQFDWSVPAFARAKRLKPRGTGYYGRFRRQSGAGRGELKFFDVTIDDAVIATGATVAIASVNLISQGITETQRIGRKCTIRHIDWRLRLRKAFATSTAGDDVVRVILYLDRQANGATATTTDVLETADFQSFYNLANQNRFRILMDRTCDLNSSAGAGDGTTNDTFAWSKTLRFNRKLRITLEFSDAAGVITNLRSNNIGVLTLSSNGTSELQSQMRIRFSDH